VLSITHQMSIDFLSTLEAAKRRATTQIVEGLPEGVHRALPAPQDQRQWNTDEDLINAGSSDDKFSMHPDDSHNFLKLCSALRILVQRRLVDPDIDFADRLIREYCTELIPVRLPRPNIFTGILILRCSFTVLAPLSQTITTRLMSVSACGTSGHSTISGRSSMSVSTKFSSHSRPTTMARANSKRLSSMSFRRCVRQADWYVVLNYISSPTLIYLYRRPIHCYVTQRSRFTATSQRLCSVLRTKNGVQ
jgi:hypothetical protein